MRMRRLLTPVAALAMVAAIPALPAAPAHAAPKDDGLSLVVPTLAPMLPGQRGWVIVFRGNRPNLDNFRVTLDAPPGLAVSYPGGGPQAGLDTSPKLPVGRDDRVAVRFDATALSPGSYGVLLKATYTGGSFDGKLTVVVV